LMFRTNLPPTTLRFTLSLQSVRFSGDGRI
jgi:hypothetical protein